MPKQITLEKDLLLEVLTYLKKEDFISNTHQFAGVEETEINGERKVRLNFRQWSYPYVMGRESSCMLPDRFYTLLNY